jgi:hypothetical protein
MEQKGLRPLLGEAVRNRELEGRLRSLLCAIGVQAKLMKLSSPVEGLNETEGMGELPRERDRFAASLEGLRGEAQEPERPRQVAQARHAVVRRSIRNGMRGSPLGAGEREALLQMGSRQGELAKVVQDRPDGIMGAQQGDRIVVLPGQPETFFCQFPHPMKLGPIEIQHAQASQDPEQERCLPDLSAQLSRADVRVLHFRRRVPPGGDQRGAEGGQHGKLGLDALGSVRERGDEGPRRRHVFHGLPIRAPLHGIVGGLPSVPHGPRVVALFERHRRRRAGLELEGHGLGGALRRQDQVLEEVVLGHLDPHDADILALVDDVHVVLELVRHDGGHGDRIFQDVKTTVGAARAVIAIVRSRPGYCSYKAYTRRPIRFRPGQEESR